MYVGLCQLAVTVLSHKRLWVLHSKQFIVRLKKNSLPVLTGTWRTWYNRYTSKKGSKRGVNVSLGPVVTPTRWIYSRYTLDMLDTSWCISLTRSWPSLSVYIGKHPTVLWHLPTKVRSEGIRLAEKCGQLKLRIGSNWNEASKCLSCVFQYR